MLARILSGERGMAMVVYGLLTALVGLSSLVAVVTAI